MAEGLMNALYGDRFVAWSAGTEPSEVNDYAVKVMKEIGIDISGHRSKSVEEFLEQDFAYVVTVCNQANEACPFFLGGKERIHKSFEDPAAIEGNEELKLAGFRRTRDEIKAWIDKSLSDMKD
jgi:arsenate reductase